MCSFTCNFTLYIRFLGEHTYWNKEVWKITPKCPLIKSKMTLFLETRQVLIPSRDSHESHSVSKRQSFFAFSLVTNVYNSIRVAPPGDEQAIIKWSKDDCSCNGTTTCIESCKSIPSMLSPFRLVQIPKTTLYYFSF